MPVLFQQAGNELGFDEQTCRNLEGWAQQFDRVIMACPTVPYTGTANGASSNWQALSSLSCFDRLELVPLPYAYSLTVFLKTYGATRQLLAQKIREADYLCFAFCSLIGEWAGVAALETIAQRRPYSIWIDRVEYEVTRRTLSSETKIRQLYHGALIEPTRRFHHFLAQRSTLGLFQGMDCFSAYQTLCPEPHCVYDVHTTKADHIRPEVLQAKLANLRRGEPLHLGYMGRAVAMKGPFDWLEALRAIHQAGANIQATWLGDGPDWEQMRSLVQDWGLETVVQLPGFVGDHGKILAAMQDSDIFMFCHKTPESPRCLVESLVSGTPIVGYGSPYTEGLVQSQGGGLFVPCNDWQQLAQRIIALDRDRDRLCDLITAAAASGRQFSEEDLFQNRADLIKRYLDPQKPERQISAAIEILGV